MAIAIDNRAASLRADIEAGILDAYRAEGFVLQKDGTDKPSKERLAEAVLERMLQTVSRNKKEREARAIGKADLAALMFPSTPNPSSAEWDAYDEVMTAVWSRILTEVSKMVATGRRGKIQRVLASNVDTEELLVCTTTVGPAEVKSVYLTDNEALILADWAVPRTSRLNNMGADIADDFAFAIQIKPGLRKSLMAKMEDGLKATTNSARAKLALTSGSEDES